jgi:hypothetical protein
MSLMFDGCRNMRIRKYIVGFKVLIAEAMKVAIFWDIAPYSMYVKRQLEWKYHLHLQSRKSSELETRV